MDVYLLPCVSLLAFAVGIAGHVFCLLLRDGKRELECGREHAVVVSQELLGNIDLHLGI